jgi:hypothetical protein
VLKLQRPVISLLLRTSKFIFVQPIILVDLFERVP